MTPNDVRQEIDNCLDLMVHSGITLIANPVVVERNGRKARVTWRSPAGLGTLEGAYPFASVDEYREHLRNQAYSAVLCDGSLLQMSYEFSGTRLSGHRLCFYPCPFDVEPEYFQTDPVLDVIDLHRVAAEPSLRLRSPIRFDYDPTKTSEGHPAVHVHMLWGHCRCAVNAPLSVGHFLQFVFCNFFPSIWEQHEFLRKWKRVWRERTITDDEAFSLHLSATSRDAESLLRR